MEGRFLNPFAQRCSATYPRPHSLGSQEPSKGLHTIGGRMWPQAAWLWSPCLQTFRRTISYSLLNDFGSLAVFPSTSLPPLMALTFPCWPGTCDGALGTDEGWEGCSRVKRNAHAPLPQLHVLSSDDSSPVIYMECYTNVSALSFLSKDE